MIERIVDISTLLSQFAQFGMFNMSTKIGLFLVYCFNFLLLVQTILHMTK